MNLKKNIKMTIAYDGTNYSGWQRQKEKRSIQGTIESQIRKITGETQLKIYGSGRTDAGVHAFGQVANFFTEASIPIDKWSTILNQQLPGDIRILSARKVNITFHARYSAKSKIYHYYILNKLNRLENLSARDAFLKNYYYYYNKKLDINKLRKAAFFLTGYHDFSAFSCFNQGKGKMIENRIRNIKNISIMKKGELVSFSIEADAFLYKMVRMIIGTLMDFSSCQKKPEEMIKILKHKDSQKSGKVVPANGLYLMKVKYR